MSGYRTKKHVADSGVVTAGCNDDAKHPHGHCKEHCAECRDKRDDPKHAYCTGCQARVHNNICVRCGVNKIIEHTTMCEDCWRNR